MHTLKVGSVVDLGHTWAVVDKLKSKTFICTYPNSDTWEKKYSDVK